MGWGQPFPCPTGMGTLSPIPWGWGQPRPCPCGLGTIPLPHWDGDNPAPVLVAPVPPCPLPWQGHLPFPWATTIIPILPTQNSRLSPSRTLPPFSPSPSRPIPASSCHLQQHFGDKTRRRLGTKPPPNPPCVFPGQNTGMKAVPGVPDLWERVRRSFGAGRQNSLMSPISGGLAGAVTSARTRRRFHPPRQRRKSRQGAGKMFQRVGKRGIFGFFPSFPPLIPHRRHWGCHSGAQEMSPRVCSPWFGAGGGKGSGGALLVGKDSPNPTNPTKPMPSPLPCVLCWV